MRKLFLTLMVFIVSTSVFAWGWSNKWNDWWKGHNYYYKEHVTITPELDPNYKVSAGEQAIFKGRICLRDQKDKSKKKGKRWGWHDFFNRYKDDKGCKKIKDSDQFSKHELKFFFPDTNTEVTDQVEVVDGKYELTYFYKSQEINPAMLNRFTVIVKERDYALRKYLKLQAKIQRHIEILKDYKHKNRFKKYIERYLEKLERILAGVKIKIDTRLHRDPKVYSRLDYPVQVENKIAPKIQYSKVVSGFRLNLIVSSGVMFEGEKTRVQAEVLNLNEQENDEKGDHKDYWRSDRYKWKYWATLSLDEQIVQQSQKKLLSSEMKFEFDYLTDKLSINNLNNLGLHFYRGKEVPKHASAFHYLKEQTWGEINYKLDVQEDNQAPSWTYGHDLPVRYLKDLASHQFKVLDSLGRVDKESFDIKLEGVLVDGSLYSTDLTISSEYEKMGDEFSAGANTGANGYEVVSFFSELAEGDYTYRAKVSDFFSNEAQVLESIFHIDRTVPVLTIDQADNQLTNNPSFQIGYEIEDRSPTTLKVIQNGIELTTIENKIGVVDILLQEGVNTFELHTVDAAGNIAQVVKLNNIELDTIPPELSDIKPENNDILFALKVAVSGKSNEPLSKVLIENKEAEVSGLNFQLDIFKQIEGLHSTTIAATDLAGNTKEITVDYEILLKLLRIEMVSLTANNGKIDIIGHEGAARPGVSIEIDGGFFNDADVVAASDGSFSASLNYAPDFDFTAIDNILNQQEEYTIGFQADTTLSGIIKDTEDVPLPGVKVTIESSGQSAYTDSNGVFSLSKPVTGDQKIIVDGRTIPAEFSENKKYSYLSFNVSLGNLQRNALERVIYLAPIYEDIAVEVKTDETTVVESTKAPGVILEVAANTANFPSGLANKISIVEIDADKTSIDLLDFSRPDSVYAFEPSGTTFSSTAKVILPNPNEFPVGTEIVLMSKNSNSGYWEPDGVAIVNGAGMIETKEGQGISHFSEIYATPYGVKIEPYTAKHKPGIYNDQGALSKSLSLPTYKSMGTDKGISLNYNSFWANPNVFVTNTFNTPTEHIYKKVDDSAGGFGTKVKVDGYVEVWQKPDMLKSQFTSGPVQTDWLYFDVSNPPKQSTVSYSVDMSEVDSGVYPALATYVLQYRYIKVQRIRIRKERIFGGTFTKYMNEDVDELMDAIFPPPLQTNLYVQNKKNSQMGTGWKLGAAEKIYNVDSNQVVIEEKSGQLTPYVLKTTVENLYSSNDEINYMTIDEDGEVYIFKNNNDMGKINNGAFLKQGSLPDEPITIGMDKALKARNTVHGIDNKGKEFTSSPSRANWKCLYQKYTGRSQIIPRSAFVEGNKIFLVDTNHRFYNINNSSKAFKIGINNNDQTYHYSKDDDFYIDTIGMSYQEMEDAQKHVDYVFEKTSDSICRQYSYVGCESKIYEQVGYTRTHLSPWTGYSGCRLSFAGWWEQKGSIPTSGYDNGSFSESSFNSPHSVLRVSNDEILVADRGNNLIRMVNLATNLTYDFAGNRQTNDTLSGNKDSVGIYHPTGLAQDNFGNIYFSSERGYIRKIDPNGNVSHVAGSPNGKFQATAPAKDTFLKDPYGLAIDSQRGFLYVADTGNHRIVQIDLVKNISQAIAGTNICTSNDVKNGKAALNVSICSPKHIALDREGNLVYLDARNKMIKKIIIDHGTSGSQRYVPVNANDNSQLIRLSDGSFERKFRNGAFNTYSKEGLQLASVDKIGNITSYEYSNGQISRVIDPTGGVTQINISGNKVRSVTDPAGRVTSFYYYGNHLDQVSYPDGSVEKFTYNEKGMMTSETNKRGFVTSYSYNQSDKLVEINRPDEKKVEFEDGLNHTFVAGNYDENNKAEISDGTNKEINDIYTDAKGFETELKKDHSGLVTQVTDSKDRVTTIERDLDARPIKITRFDNTYTEFQYNDFGDLIYKYDSDSGEQESFVYNDFGELLSYTNSKGKKKNIVYHADFGLPTKETDFNGNSIYRTYYNDGLLKTTYNDKGETTEFFYDSLGNLNKKVSPLGEETNYIRDLAGNIVEKINANGISTIYSYDKFNRLTQVSTGVSADDPVGKITSYEYSPTGQLVKIIDPYNNVTSFEYDQMDRLAKKTTALGQVTELAYDGNGNVIWEKDPNGAEKTFEYDSDNLLTKKILPDNIYEMNYDDYGNMTLISDSDSAIEFEYEKIGKEYYVSETKTQGENIPSVSLNYSYDILGNRTQMDTPYGAFKYYYDDGNRLIGLTNHKSEDFDFFYDSANRLTKIERPGSQTEFSFDKNSFLTALAHKKGNSSVINQFIYTRDNLGNRTSIISSRGTASYGYDDESQLNSVSNSEITGDYATESFNYDDLGNRLNDQLGNYVYDNKSQRLTEDYKHFYLYDQNGNLTSIQERGMTGNFKNLTYSSENQLVRIQEYKNSLLTKEIFYYYDALGRRMRKVVSDKENSSDSFERRYVYDGQEILAEYDSNSVIGVYTHSTLRTDDVLAVDVKSSKLANSTGSYFYLKDALGSVVDIVDGSGSLIQHYTYSSFGKILKISDSSGSDIAANPLVKTSYGFTNREHDVESGMMYYRARYMMPEIGRFIQEDPHPGKIASPMSATNKYVYTLNNPTNHRDPSGKIIPALIAGALIGGLVGGFTSKSGFVQGFLSGAAIGAASVVAITIGGAVGAAAFKGLGLSAGLGSFVGGGTFNALFAASRGATGANLAFAFVLGGLGGYYNYATRGLSGPKQELADAAVEANKSGAGSFDINPAQDNQFLINNGGNNWEQYLLDSDFHMYDFSPNPATGPSIGPAPRINITRH